MIIEKMLDHNIMSFFLHIIGSYIPPSFVSFPTASLFRAFIVQIISLYLLFAIEKLKENWNDSEILPDAILLDLNMPVMDGWQFLDEFIHLPIKKEISIFIMTSSIDPADIEMAKKYDVIKDYIMKPITANKLDMLCKLISKIN